jgi:hypothetical protein
MKENDEGSSVSGGWWNVKWPGDEDEALRRAKSMSLKENLCGRVVGWLSDAERPSQMARSPAPEGY